MSTTLTKLTDTIYQEMDLHFLTDSLSNIPSSISTTEKEKLIADMRSNALLFSRGLARAIMQCMVNTGGSFPALYCNTPGLTEITSLSQIGISSTTVGGV